MMRQENVGHGPIPRSGYRTTSVMAGQLQRNHSQRRQVHRLRVALVVWDTPSARTGQRHRQVRGLLQWTLLRTPRRVTFLHKTVWPQTDLLYKSMAWRWNRWEVYYCWSAFNGMDSQEIWITNGYAEGSMIGEWYGSRYTSIAMDPALVTDLLVFVRMETPLVLLSRHPWWQRARWEDLQDVVPLD